MKLRWLGSDPKPDVETAAAVAEKRIDPSGAREPQPAVMNELTTEQWELVQTLLDAGAPSATVTKTIQRMRRENGNSIQQLNLVARKPSLSTQRKPPSYATYPYPHPRREEAPPVAGPSRQRRGILDGDEE